MNSQMVMLLGQVFIMLAIGFTLTKIGLINQAMNDGLSKLLLKGVLPVSILSAAASPYDEKVAVGFFVVFAISLVFYFVAPFIFRVIAHRMPLPEKAHDLFATMCVFGNVGFIGIPLTAAIFGPTGLIYAISLNIAWNLSMFSIGNAMLSGERGFEAKRVLLDVNMIATYIMMFFYFIQPYFDWYSNDVVATALRAMNSVGGMMTPLSLFVIGFAIANMNVSEFIRDKFAYLVSFVRLLLIPLIFIGIFALTPFDPEIERVIVFMLALPCATVNVIFANLYKLNVGFCSRAVTGTMLFMLIGLPIVLTISSAVLGPSAYVAG